MWAEGKFYVSLFLFRVPRTGLSSSVVSLLLSPAPLHLTFIHHTSLEVSSIRKLSELYRKTKSDP